MPLYLLDAGEMLVATPPKKPQPKKANKVVYSDDDDDLIGASQESYSSVDIPLAQSCTLAAGCGSFAFRASSANRSTLCALQPRRPTAC
jgi:hypothetical protein